MHGNRLISLAGQTSRDDDAQIVPDRHKLIELIEMALRTRVISCSRILEGITNLVYKVETRDGDVVLKLFKNKDWPEAAKLEWIERRLSEENIPRARMLYRSNGDALYANGYAIYEYLEGDQAESLINDKQLVLEKFCGHLGALLRRIHQMKFEGFGDDNRGAGTLQDFIKRRLVSGPDDVDTLRRIEGEDQSLYLRARDRVEQNLRLLGQRYAPVLTHGDPNPKNCIWMEGDKLVLVDWDNAASSSWIRDYAHLTYRAAARAREDDVAEYMITIRDSFFKSYGEIDYSFTDLTRIESAWHIIWAHNSLPFLRRKIPDAFTRRRSYLLSLLA
jgi:Ser/Thr protein kinase RdoA (MazF antagonist)